MLTQPYVEDACSGRFPKPRVFSENFHALLFPKDPLARSLASSLPPALVFVEGIDAYTLEEMTIFSSYLASIHGLHRTAKGSALDVGYANPQLDARIRKGSAR